MSEFKEPSEEVAERLYRQFNFPYGAIQVLPGNFLYPRGFTKIAEQIRNFKIDPKDTFILSYPKTGTTWCQEIVWLLTNNCDITTAKAVSMFERSPFLEKDMFEVTSTVDLKKVDEVAVTVGTLARLQETPPPRVIKTHLPPSLLPTTLLDTCKVVCCLRNPKDTIVSYYHHSRLLKMHDFKGTFEEFVDMFINDELVFSPYFGLVKQIWALRHHPNVCVVMFEDLKRDLPKELKRIAAFFSVDLTPKQEDDLCDHLSFSSMSKNKQVNKKILEDNEETANVGRPGFMRKGQIGDWRNHFTPEINSKVDKWIQENMAHIEGLEFYYGED